MQRIAFSLGSFSHGELIGDCTIIRGFRGMKHLGINGGAFVGNNAEYFLRLLIALGPTSMVLN